MEIFPVAQVIFFRNGFALVPLACLFGSYAPVRPSA